MPVVLFLYVCNFGVAPLLTAVEATDVGVNVPASSVDINAPSVDLVAPGTSDVQTVALYGSCFHVNERSRVRLLK